MNATVPYNPALTATDIAVITPLRAAYAAAQETAEQKNKEGVYNEDYGEWMYDYYTTVSFLSADFTGVSPAGCEAIFRLSEELSFPAPFIEQLAENPATPLPILIEIASTYASWAWRSASETAGSRVVSDPRTPRDVVEEMAYRYKSGAARLSSDPDTTTAQLDKLIDRWGLLPAIATHPNLSMDTVRDRFIQHKNYGSSDSPEAEVVKARLSREQLLSLLTKRTTRWVAALVVACPRITPDDIVVFAHSTDVGLRAEVAASERLTPAVEALLAVDASPTVRAALAGNEDASARVLNSLTGDSNTQVKTAARLNPMRLLNATTEEEAVTEELVLPLASAIGMAVVSGNPSLVANREDEVREAVIDRYPELAAFAATVTLEVLLTLVKADNRF